MSEREPGTVAERVKQAYTPWDFDRWWLHERLLVSGSIQSAADFERIRVAYGITHVLSVECERSDYGKVPADMLEWLPTIDDGSPQPAFLLQRAAAYGSKALDGGGTLLVHCQQGVSRSPTYGYAILRSKYGLTRDQFLARIRRQVCPTWGEHQFHPVYLNSVEDAIRLPS